MGPLSADFTIDLTNDNALQLPTAHAGLAALPEPPASIKDKVLDPLTMLTRVLKSCNSQSGSRVKHTAPAVSAHTTGMFLSDVKRDDNLLPHGVLKV